MKTNMVGDDALAEDPDSIAGVWIQ